MDHVLRVTPEHLNRLLGLAGESLVESRWLSPFVTSLTHLKRMHNEASGTLDALVEAAISGAGIVYLLDVSLSRALAAGQLVPLVPESCDVVPEMLA